MTPPKNPKQRLDQRVLEMADLPDLKAAQGLIMAGKVVVDGAVVTAVGTLVPVSAHIHLRERPLRFASRGGYKLERALREFDVEVTGRVCLDAGASTGGFTDCLLKAGAARVYAVDVGYGQLRGRLAIDPRVVNRERTNISDVARADLEPPIELLCADLSYLSLRKSVPILTQLFTCEPHMILLVKPLYEGLAQEDITNRAALAAVLQLLVTDLQALGQLPSDSCVSPIFGGRGAIEFFFRFGGRTAPCSPAQLVSNALQDLTEHPPIEMPEAGEAGQ